MVILNKLKASSLNEVIVATVIIMLVFGIAVATLGNLIINTGKQNTNGMENRLNELEYQYRNNLLKIPFAEEEENWDVDIRELKEEGEIFIEFEIKNKNNNKIINRRLVSSEKG